MNFDNIFKKMINEADQTELLNQMINKSEPNENENDEEDIEDVSEKDNEKSDNSENNEDEDNEDFEDEDDEDNKEKKKEQELKQQKNKEIQEKLNQYSNQIVSDLKFQVDKKSKIILSDFRTYGPQETIKRFVENIFIPKIKDSEEKIFLTLNIDDLATMATEKLSDKFLQVK